MRHRRAYELPHDHRRPPRSRPSSGLADADAQARAVGADVHWHRDPRPVAVARLPDRDRAAHGHRLRSPPAVLDPARPGLPDPVSGRARLAPARRASARSALRGRAADRVVGLARARLRHGQPGHLSLALETLGLVLSILLLTAVGAVAAPGLKPLETLAAAAVLIVLSWTIFILGLGLTIPVWPEW